MVGKSGVGPVARVARKVQGRTVVVLHIVNAVPRAGKKVAMVVATAVAVATPALVLHARTSAVETSLNHWVAVRVETACMTKA